ncbi:MAG: efflux RND transporter periplasmic adaptor subunit [Gemmatimonadaceae bacterium]|nr:efflux RND transporter periplasmic adaptor subunit [Gemmatimonadaceae bacterium]
MKTPPLTRRTVAVASVGTLLLALFAFVAVRSGPLAPIAVTVATVELRSVAPALFGIGTVESRYAYRIGPTSAGRVKRVLVDVGDHVTAGQLLGEMDVVDLDERVQAQQATVRRIDAVQREADTRQRYSLAEEHRYEELLAARSTSVEIVAAKRQARQLADAALDGAIEERVRARADRDALIAQRWNLRLVAPVSGLVIARDVEPGTTVVAGQSVVEVVDPRSFWINVRFDQRSAVGLRHGLSARVVLRSRDVAPLAARVLRIEPRADVVTEELLAKIVFDAMPDPLPSIGELAEVTVGLPVKTATPTIPNAAVHRVDGRVGVWQIVDGEPTFAPLTLGASDLDGHVQVLKGLDVGARVVVYSAKALSAHSRITIVDQLTGAVR